MGSAAPRPLQETDVVVDLLVRSLVRAQLRLALGRGALLVVLVAGLPLLFAVVPDLGDFRVAGLRLPWLLLGIGVYPFLWVTGWSYVRAAERNERDFVELVERS